MKTILSLVLLSSLYFNSLGQSVLSEQDDYIRGKSLYLNFANGELNYFTETNFDDQEPLKKNHQLSLKHTYSNLYLNWLNPLKYKITWKDSTYTDDRDQLAINFIGILANQFGVPVTGMQSSSYTKSSIMKPSSIGTTTLAKPSGNINSLEIFEFYLTIRNDIDNVHRISETELVTLNSLLDELFKLDEMAAVNIPDFVEKSFLRLYNITSSTEVEKICKRERESKENNDNIENIKNSQERISNITKKIEVKNDEILAAYIKKSALFFSNKLGSECDKNKILLSNLETIIKSVESSVKNRESKIHPGFFLIRNIDFDPGKSLETGVTITEYEYNNEKKEFLKKSDIFQSKIKFRKADFVIVDVSAGLFYSQATLKSFGISTSGQMTVTENNIDKNTAVAATLLNLYFNLNSRYFAPLIQLGIDPTKKNPYLLSGIGFSIPAAKFSISGGLIWTWDATLTKLSVGSVITSTTELEDDINYKFDSKPKGWYLGLQYNF